MKNITIFGKGNMGKVIAVRFEKAGNTVTLLGSKDEVSAIGDIVVLAVPYAAVASILEANKDKLNGKIIVDITNPVNFATMDDLLVGADSSVSEAIAHALPKASVIKAFNTNFASTLAGDAPTNVLLASNDEDAKATLTSALEGSGLVLVDAGSLKRARELEALGFLQITLAIRGKIGWTGGFALEK
ncbi:MAG: NADPH-dependent F420 reductase [Erysipelotrichaceae bacterium]